MVLKDRGVIIQGGADVRRVLVEDRVVGNDIENAPLAVLCGMAQSVAQTGVCFAAAGRHGECDDAGCG